MLVLSRMQGENILVNDIVITVVSIHKGKVRLGIEAPKSVVIHRQEVHDAIQAARKDVER